jgi:hypothetical protein
MWPDLVELLKWRIAAWLLRWTIALMPEHAWERKALERELREQRDYERYTGYTLLMGAAVIPFDQWRSEWRGMTRLRRPLQMPQRQFSDYPQPHEWSSGLEGTLPTVFKGPAGDSERRLRRKVAGR